MEKLDNTKTQIGTALGWVQKRLNLLLAAGIVVLLLLLLHNCDQNRTLESKLLRANQNQKALLDTVKIVKNKAGELQAERMTFIASKEELKQLSASLFEETKKQRGEVLQLTSANAEITNRLKGLQTSVTVDTEYVYVNNGNEWPKKYRLNWSYDTTYSIGNYSKFAGFSRVSLLNDSTLLPGLTDITENTQGFALVTGLLKEGDDYRIFVKSNHPGFVVNAMEGAIIPGKNNPLFGKPQKWGLGVSVGPNFSWGYGIGGKGLFVGIGATFGLNYNMIKF